MHDDLIAGRYKPLFTRARGGFSDVIIAWDTTLARRVAIKHINSGVNLPVASLEEARTTALLSCPNIVSVYDFVSSATETLIIMENVDGPSLAELMSNSTELLEVDVVTAILDGVVAALEYAHENQALHLDIKPANILIDQSGHIKVSDFGLAELADSEGFGEVQGGTIGYMPPEQLTGQLVDERTDIWALAILSYQLLTGVNPFFALSLRESLDRIISGHYALPSELRPVLSGGVDEALVKALRPQAEERPATIAEFWLELRPYLGKVGNGRRKLKALTSAWAGREAAQLEGSASTNTELDILDEQADEELTTALDASEETEYSEQSTVSIWNNTQEDEGYWAEEEARRQQRREARRARARERAAREPGPPLWQRLSPGGQTLVTRCFSALATSGMVWIAMSALPYLSDPLAQAATAAAANTGNPSPALLDAAFAVRLACMIITAIVTFALPSIGAALAVVSLGLGFFFTGNWLLGILVLGGGIAWWICVGRRSPHDATIFMLAPLLATVSLPMLVPLLSGYFQSWRRALGTTAFSFLLCSLLSLLTLGFTDTLFAALLGFGEMPVYGQFNGLPLEDLLSASPTLMQMPTINLLFIPLINLITSAEFWFILAGWLGASVVMSLLNSGKSRVKYIVVTLLGSGIVAAGYLFPFFLFVGPSHLALLAALIIRLLIALAVCLLLIALGVPPKPSVNEDKGRKR